MVLTRLRPSVLAYSAAHVVAKAAMSKSSLVAIALTCDYGFRTPLLAAIRNDEDNKQPACNKIVPCTSTHIRSTGRHGRR